MCLAAIAVVAVLVTVTVLVGQMAAGSATLAPPFLSSRPCVVVLALVPAAIGLATLGVMRLVRRHAHTTPAVGE